MITPECGSGASSAGAHAAPAFRRQSATQEDCLAGAAKRVSPSAERQPHFNGALQVSARC